MLHTTRYILALLLALAQFSAALEPPGELTRSQGPSAAIDAALAIGNPAFSPELLAGLASRAGGGKGVNQFSLWGRGMPAEGKPKMLVLLVDFDEYPARPADTPEAMAARIFGSDGAFPYESLSAYYRRSSYGKLNIEGTVLGWYRAGRRADVPQTREGREALIKAAIRSYKKHDFSQYDANGDGTIDSLAVIWTGPIGDWATFWWAVAPRFYDSGFQPGGKNIGFYSWQGILSKWEDPAAGFNPKILIHETGHNLGLPDYYDYKPGVGPDGGLGAFDMMDSTRYDHNCFTKMMLGWVTPKRISTGGTYTLRPSSEAGECLLLLPPGKNNYPFGEFFLLENRRAAGNDSAELVGGGLVVWHVDARLNSDKTNFLYDNHTTEHKLLRVLESDGEEEIEQGPNRKFNFFDFYLPGRTLGPDTVPSSRLYDGTGSGFSLISRGGDRDVSFTLTLK